MSKSRPFGFGIIGLGMIADYHARAIARTVGGRVAGICGRSEAKTREFADSHGIPFQTTSADELARHPEVDAVCIATPTGAHLEPALAAIRAGKHLVVEKPVETTLERVDAILDAADRARVRLAAIFQSRFGEGAQTVKTAIDAGRFGRLALASAYVKWYRKPEYYAGSWHGTLALDGGGALMNQGSHAVDLLQWFAGMPEEVFAWTGRLLHTGIEAEDTACANLRFANGAMGSIEASTASFPGLRRRIEICGTDGSAVLEDDQVTRWEFRSPLPGDAAVLAAGPNDAMRGGSAAPNQISLEGHRRQFQDMIDACAENRPLTIDGREARKAVAIIRAVYESAASGKPVRL